MKVIDALCAGAHGPDLPPALVVVAHPDDETVGAGSRLPRLRHAWFVYVTDGAPLDGRDAARHGLSPAQYRDLRRRERTAALARAGIGPDRVIELDCPDQQAARRLPQLSVQIAELLARHRPGVVLTHPYEGGHPDHDAAAFAVQAAVALLREGAGPAPQVVEMACYHQGPHGLRAGEFLPHEVADRHARVVSLDARERADKQVLLDCYASQRETLAQFPLAVERFRPAPPRDFRQPPHAGPLLYERFPWGIDGTGFRTYAAQAMAQLGLERAA